jgi:hypothetical protein
MRGFLAFRAIAVAITGLVAAYTTVEGAIVSLPAFGAAADGACGTTIGVWQLGQLI